MTKWDESQYLKFADARTRPAMELLTRVPVTDATRVVDLGSGPGNSTALLCARWPEARITGVDNSPEMLRAARTALPDVEWVEADVSHYVPEGPVDVFFANALLQWVPNHENILRALLAGLRQGGALAFQMPHNFEEPSHRLMREVLGPWTPNIEAVQDRTRVKSPGYYYDVLAPGAAHVDVWQTRYEHVMADAHAIVEWVKGTGLRPYLDAVAPPDRAAYLAEYERAIAANYPARADGKRLFSFPRIFVVAVR